MRQVSFGVAINRHRAYAFAQRLTHGRGLGKIVPRVSQQIERRGIKDLQWVLQAQLLERTEVRCAMCDAENSRYSFFCAFQVSGRWSKIRPCRGSNATASEHRLLSRESRIVSLSA